jgi:hypothetical protein
MRQRKSCTAGWARWQRYGLPKTDMNFKVEENDLPNGVAIIEGGGSQNPQLNRGSGRTHDGRSDQGRALWDT